MQPENQDTRAINSSLISVVSLAPHQSFHNSPQVWHIMITRCLIDRYSSGGYHLLVENMNIHAQASSTPFLPSCPACCSLCVCICKMLLRRLAVSARLIIPGMSFGSLLSR